MRRLAQETLESLLLPGEQALWVKHRSADYLHSLLLMVCGIGGIMIGIAAFFWYVPNWTGTFYFLDTDIVVPPLVVYLGILTCLYIPIFYVTYDAFIHGRRAVHQSGMSLADLKHHHETFVLTNQRWIQKGAPRFLVSDPARYSSGAVSVHDDVLSVALNACERAIVRKVVLWYQVSFLIANAVADDPPLLLIARLTKPEVDALLVPLRQLVPVVDSKVRGNTLPSAAVA